MAKKKVDKEHLCQKCGKLCPDIYCATCAALIQGEALNEKGGVLAGNKSQRS